MRADSPRAVSPSGRGRGAVSGGGGRRPFLSSIASNQDSPFKNGLKNKVSENLSAPPPSAGSSSSGAARAPFLRGLAHGSWAPTASAAEVGRPHPGAPGPLRGSWTPRRRPPLALGSAIPGP